MEAKTSYNFGFLKPYFEDTPFEDLHLEDAESPKEIVESVWKASQQSSKSRSVRVDKSLKMCQDFLETLLGAEPLKKSHKTMLHSLCDETCAFLEKRVEKEEFRGDTKALEKIFATYHKEHPQTKKTQKLVPAAHVRTSSQNRLATEAFDYFQSSNSKASLKPFAFEGKIDEFWAFFDQLKPAIPSPKEEHIKRLRMELSMNSERIGKQGDVFRIELIDFATLLSQVPFKETQGDLQDVVSGIMNNKEILAQTKKRKASKSAKEPVQKKVRPSTPPRQFVQAPQNELKEPPSSYLRLGKNEKEEIQREQQPQYVFPKVPQEPPREKKYGHLKELEKTAKHKDNYTYSDIEAPKGQTFARTIETKTRPLIQALFQKKKLYGSSKEVQDVEEVLFDFWHPKGDRKQFAIWLTDQIRNVMDENFLQDDNARENFLNQLQEIDAKLKNATLRLVCKELGIRK